MEQFSISDSQPNEELEFSLREAQRFRTPSDAIFEMVASLNAARSDAPKNIVRSQLDALGFNSFDGDSRSDASSSAYSRFSNAGKSAIETSSLEPVLEAGAKFEEEISVANTTKAPEALALASRPGTLFDATNAKAKARLATLYKITEEVLGEAGKDVGFFSILADIGDIVLSSFVDPLTGGGFSRAKEAQTVGALLSANITEEEFEREVRATLERGRDAGWLTDDNYLYLAGAATNLQELGVGTEAALDKISTALDVVLGPADAIGLAALGVRAVRRAKNTTALVSSLAGPKAGAKNLVEAALKPNTSESVNAGVAREMSPSMTRMPESEGGEFLWYAPGVEIGQRLRTEDSFFNYVRNLGFSRRVDPALFEGWKRTGIARLAAKVDAENSNRVADIRVGRDNQDNLFGNIVFGTMKGMPFKTEKSAKALASRLGTSAVVEPVSLGNEVGYFVRSQHNLPSGDLVNPLTNEEIGQAITGAFRGMDEFKGFFSSMATMPARLDALAKRSEGVVSLAFNEARVRWKAATKGVSKEEMKAIENVFFDLRDAEHLSHMRRPLNRTEFINEFMTHSNKVPPSEKAIRMYEEVQDINDTLYYFKADNIFKQHVNNGFDEVVLFSTKSKDKDIADSWKVVSKPVTDIEKTVGTGTILDPTTGIKWTVDDLPKGTRVFQPATPFEFFDGDYKFIALPGATKTRRVYHTDVYGYNPGGPRTYEFLNHAVKQEGSGGRHITLAGTATRKEAETMRDQVNTVLIGLRDRIGGLGKAKTKGEAIETLEAFSGVKDIDDLIRLNNDWNPDIESLDTFLEWVKRSRVDPRANVGSAAMDDVLTIPDDAGKLKVVSTEREAFEFAMNSPSSGPRRDLPLRGFGGAVAPTRSPLATIQNDYLRTMHQHAFGAYSFQAVSGWVKGARDLISNYDKIEHLTPLGILKKAEFGTKPSKEVRNFMAARDTILRQLGARGSHEAYWDRTIQSIAEWVYDSGAKKQGVWLRNNPIVGAPAQKLRALTFHAKLGMFAFDQLFIQASQAINIYAIMGPMRSGEFFQAALSHIPARLAMLDGSPDFIKEVGRRVASFTGMDADEWENYIKWVKDSGRLNVGDEVAEMSSHNTKMAEGMLKKGLKIGRTFFDEGEKFPRSVAMHVAWKEYRKKFPKADPFSEHGISWITDRQDKLTAGMTGASAASFQRGPFSVATQFMTFTSRMMESLFTNRVLTVAERKRLAVAQIMLWGSSGAGLGWAYDQLVLEEVLPTPSKAEYTALKYGLLDTIIGYASGGEFTTAFGERLAPFAGLSDLARNINDKNIVGTFTGPGGELLGRGLSDTWDIFNSIATGNAEITQSDLAKMARNLSSFNRGFQAYYLFKTGEYFSRKDPDAIVDGLGPFEGMMTAFGADIIDSDLTYAIFNYKADQKKYLFEYGTMVGRYMSLANDRFESGDIEGANSLYDLASKELAKLQPHELSKVMKQIEPQYGSLFESVVRASHAQGQALAIPGSKDDEVKE